MTKLQVIQARKVVDLRVRNYLNTIIQFEILCLFQIKQKEKLLAFKDFPNRMNYQKSFSQEK